MRGRKIKPYSMNSQKTPHISPLRGIWLEFFVEKTPQDIESALCLECLYSTTDLLHYNDIIMSAIASQVTSLTTVYSTIYSDTVQRKHQSSASLTFVRGTVNSSHKGPVTRKMFPFDDVIMFIHLILSELLTYAHLDKTAKCLKTAYFNTCIIIFHYCSQ